VKQRVVIARRHRDLNRHRAFDGINDRHELSQQTIARGLADTTAVLR
jgi:hypothetical protein